MTEIAVCWIKALMFAAIFFLSQDVDCQHLVPSNLHGHRLGYLCLLTTINYLFKT
jgi:hypothetical protein